MTHTCDVAIVGGGIGGLTLAASLAQQSLSVQVFEQDNQLREIGAGIAIGGNATRLLHRLGVDLSQVANVPPAIEFHRWKDGRLLWSHPIGEWYRHEVGAALLMLHRATLQRFLAAAVPPDCIRLSRRLAGLSDESAGVRLHFADGEDVVARVVAGVDGVNSTVRRYVCGDVAPAHSGEIGFRGVIPVEKSRDLPDPTALNIWCGPGTHVVYYGLDRGELVNLLAVYKPHRRPAWTRSSNRLQATSDQALAIFTEYGWDPRVLDLVRNIEGDMSFWALVDLPRLPRWSRGRVVILGDAAHAPLPHQGQGAGLAIEDAYALGALLGSGGLDHYGSAFEAFEHLRKRRTALVQAYARAAGRAIKFADDAATRRDASWPSLPQRIGWIHRYREEEMLPSSPRFGAGAPAGRAVLRRGGGRAVRLVRRAGRDPGSCCCICARKAAVMTGQAGKPRILIVGAGIAGVALAASLERFGIAPAVVEIERASMSRGLALMLTSNVAVALGRVGLDAVVLDHGIELQRIIHLDPSGALAEDVHDLGPSNERYAPNLGITRDGLMSALSTSVRAQVRYATTITSIVGLAEEPEVVFSDGTSGRFDLVVGADGVGSAVRRLIYPDIQPAYRSFCAWRTVMECPDRDPVFRLSTTTGRFLGSFPVGPDLVYAFLLAHSREVPVLSRDERLARLKELAAEFRGNISPLIQQQQDPSRVIFVPVQEVETPSYYRGRVLLIGDAAHAFSPLLAQGAAMAIEDAVALAELLGGDGDIGRVLRSYESRRRSRVETIRAAVRRRTVARGMEGPVTPELLNQHPPVFSPSLKAFDELIEDQFAPAQHQPSLADQVAMALARAGSGKK